MAKRTACLTRQLRVIEKSPARELNFVEGTALRRCSHATSNHVRKRLPRTYRSWPGFPSANDPSRVSFHACRLLRSHSFHNKLLDANNAIFGPTTQKVSLAPAVRLTPRRT